MTGPTLTDMAALGFSSAATFYYAGRLIHEHGNRDPADAILAGCGGRLTADQWAYVEHHHGLPPTGQLSIGFA